MILYNGRIYTPLDVIINQVVICENGHIVSIVDADSFPFRENVVSYNAKNIIISPGFIDICAKASGFDGKIESFESALRKLQAQQLKFGVTAMCVILPIEFVAQYVAQLSSILKKCTDVEVLGVRLDCKAISDINIIRSYLEIITPYISITDVILSEDNTNFETILKITEYYSIKVCLHLSTEHFLDKITKYKIDCISVPFQLAEKILHFDGWIELIQPDYYELEANMNANLSELVKRKYGQILFGNHRQMASSKSLNEMLTKFNYHMFYSNLEDHEFVAQNQAIRIFNSKFGVPLNKAIGICTINASEYLGLKHFGQVSVGNVSHFCIFDAKMNIHKTLILSS